MGREKGRERKREREREMLKMRMKKHNALNTEESKAL